MIGRLLLAVLVLLSACSPPPPDLSGLDPAIRHHLADAPEGHAGIAHWVNQFMRVGEARTLLEKVGYKCESMAEGTATVALPGVRTTRCSQPGFVLFPGELRVILKARHPDGWLVAAEAHRHLFMTSLSGENRPFTVDDMSVRGIVFSDVAALAAFVVDSLQRVNPYFACLDNPAGRNCPRVLAERQARGWATWNGKPIDAGTLEDALGSLVRRGFDCNIKNGSVDEGPVAFRVEGEDVWIDCRTASLDGQPMTVALGLALETTALVRVVVKTGLLMADIPVEPRLADDARDIQRVIVMGPDGRPAILRLTLDPATPEAPRAALPELDAASRLRVLRVALRRVETYLTAEAASGINPTLQRIDAAAGLLARVGPEVLAEWPRIGSKPSQLARGALALAQCLAPGTDDPPECFARHTAADGALAATIEAARVEAAHTVADLPSGHPARERLAEIGRLRSR